MSEQIPDWVQNKVQGPTQLRVGPSGSTNTFNCVGGSLGVTYPKTISTF